MSECSFTFYKFYCWRDDGLGFVNYGVRFASGVLGKTGLLIVPEEKWPNNYRNKTNNFVRLL